MGLVSELRRRNVFRMAVLYVVAAWLIMQVAEVLIALAKLPDWIGPTTLMLLAIGFPIAVIVSWFYEITPEGISLEKDVEPGESITHVTGRRLDFLVISLLCAAVILFAYDKWWMPAPTEQSIAVLAFENMSGDPEQEYFSDGISEELLNLLAQIPELTVISRTSAFSFKGKVVSVPEIARQLNVAHVLEGSVRKMGNRVRITAQLIEARSDSHLWSESYDRELDDIFAVQGEIAAAISDALRVKLLLGAGAAVQPNVIKTANIDAYDAYMKGRYHFNRVGEAAFRMAIRHYEEAISLDSTFALAYAALAEVCLMPPIRESEIRSLQDCERAALEAVELDDQLAEAHAALGAMRATQWDWAGSEVEFKRAIDLNPNSVMARRWYSELLRITMRLDEARREIRRAEELDPLNLFVKTMVSWPLFNQHRYEEALAQLDEVLQMDPEFGLALYNNGLIYTMMGMPEKVLTSARLAAKQLGEDAAIIRLLTASGHAIGGNEEKTLEILVEVERDFGKASPGWIAAVYLMLGQEEAALTWLEKGYEVRSPDLPNATSEPWFDALREHPRFKALRRKMGLP
jgi:serine/threonine-protein kinase